MTPLSSAYMIPATEKLSYKVRTWDEFECGLENAFQFVGIKI
jgi:hypothetical protein